MSNHPTLRAHERLSGEKVSWLLHESFDLYPVHFAGVGIFAINTSEDQDAVLTVEDSADGVTWAPVLFSLAGSAGNLSVTLAPQAYGVFLFVSAQKYVRVRVGEEILEGVDLWAVQFPPVGREGVSEAYA
jgi:hypothetical protein